MASRDAAVGGRAHPSSGEPQRRRVAASTAPAPVDPPASPPEQPPEKPKEAKLPERPVGPKTYAAFPVATPKALVIWCGDPRIQGAVNAFIAEELGLSHNQYLPITLLGGVAPLSEPLRFPKDAKFLRDTAEFVFGNFPSIERVVVISHDECARYRALQQRIGSRFLNGFASLLDRQISDLRRLGGQIVRLSGRTPTCECYHAAYADPAHTRMTFEKK
jgi:hypothetical protein